MHIKSCWPATANDKRTTQPLKQQSRTLPSKLLTCNDFHFLEVAGLASDCADQGISAANATLCLPGASACLNYGQRVERSHPCGGITCRRAGPLAVLRDTLPVGKRRVCPHPKLDRRYAVQHSKAVVLANAFGNYFPTRKQFAMFHADQVVARRPGCSSVALDEWMNPVQSPQSVSRQPGRMVNQRPVFVNERKEPIHQIRDILEMRRNVAPNENRLLAVSSPELSYRLTPRDRSIVTIAALIARNQTIEMPCYFNLALDNGAKPREISEIITHLAFYAGWANAMSAIVVAKDVFAGRKIGTDQLPPASPALLPLDKEGEAKRAAAVEQQFGDVAPGIVQYTTDVLFRDLWLRPDLAPRDRSLVTVSALIANGQVAQISYHLNRAMDNGLTQTQAAEVVTQLAFYAGWPNAFSALPVVKDVFEKRPH
jgi:4-carboxymuconolactone decarboxylase